MDLINFYIQNDRGKSHSLSNGKTFRPDGGGKNFNTNSQVLEIQGVEVSRRGKKVAFTLAEVLITIGIIGVVSALTIPSLINNYKAHRLRSQFLKSYSTIQQVFKQWEDDGLPNAEDYSTGTFYKSFKKYLNGVTDCGPTGSICYGKDVTHDYYSIFTNSSGSFAGSRINDGNLLLQDGTNIMFEDGRASVGIITVSVDLNGYKNPPNLFGYDVFMFQFSDSEFKPMGSPNTRYTNSCIRSGDNGFGCAYKAKNNPDYFKWVVKNFK